MLKQQNCFPLKFYTHTILSTTWLFHWMYTSCTATIISMLHTLTGTTLASFDLFIRQAILSPKLLPSSEAMHQRAL